MFADALEGKWGADQQKALRRNLSIVRELVDGQKHYVLTVKYMTGKPDDSKSLPSDVTRFGEGVSFLPLEYRYMRKFQNHLGS